MNGSPVSEKNGESIKFLLTFCFRSADLCIYLPKFAVSACPNPLDDICRIKYNECIIIVQESYRRC